MVAPTNLTEKRACLKPLEQLNNILRPVNIRELNYRLASVGLKSEKMCKYSHRHTSFDCFIYINTKDITHQDTFFFFASNLSSSGCINGVSLLTMKSRKSLARDVFDTYDAHSGTVTDCSAQDGGTHSRVFAT